MTGLAPPGCAGGAVSQTTSRSPAAAVALGQLPGQLVVRGVQDVHVDPGRDQCGVLRVVRRGQHPGGRTQRVPGLQGQQPGGDPRAGDQQDQHDGEVPEVDAFGGVPLARDSVSGDATTVYWL